jgi:hypothetical protein|tara:strand:+ start:6332 stop:6454 length:123 start_codon:yes stop_codon:yes gene_type:complete
MLVSPFQSQNGKRPASSSLKAAQANGFEIGFRAPLWLFAL